MIIQCGIQKVIYLTDSPTNKRIEKEAVIKMFDASNVSIAEYEPIVNNHQICKNRKNTVNLNMRKNKTCAKTLFDVMTGFGSTVLTIYAIYRQL
jgi:deoxycytidylate deaminase